MGNKTKIRFQSIEQRNKQLKAFKTIRYTIDKKDPLVVWIIF
ncbi:conserved hypothetical protein [Clostridiaceae bacterium BL-3]|jgi:hypothetical protein|nr:conserved hypothetical protein [Clostridiaceae bacterium BL-3]